MYKAQRASEGEVCVKGDVGRNIGAISMDAIGSTIGNMVVTQVAGDSVKSPTQQAISGVTGQMLPVGLSGLGYGFAAPETPVGQSFSSSYNPYNTSSNSDATVRSLNLTPGQARELVKPDNGPSIVDMNSPSGAFTEPVPYPNIRVSELPAFTLNDRATAISGNVLDTAPHPFGALASNFAGELWQGTKQLAYGMVGAESADVARENWAAGNYLTAGAKGAQSLMEAGLAITGTGPVFRVGAGMVAEGVGLASRAFGPTVDALATKMFTSSGTQLSIVEGGGVARTGGVSFGLDPVTSGGPLRELMNGNIKITSKGVAVVESHVTRFGEDAANQLMVNRLLDISKGGISGTVADYNFYTHELREFTRVRRLGFETGPLPGDVYYNAHSAALREYGIQPKTYDQSLNALYHPDAIRLMRGQ